MFSQALWPVSKGLHHKMICDKLLKVINKHQQDGWDEYSYCIWTLILLMSIINSPLKHHHPGLVYNEKFLCTVATTVMNSPEAHQQLQADTAGKVLKKVFFTRVYYMYISY